GEGIELQLRARDDDLATEAHMRRDQARDVDTGVEAEAGRTVPLGNGAPEGGGIERIRRVDRDVLDQILVNVEERRSARQQNFQAVADRRDEYDFPVQPRFLAGEILGGTGDGARPIEKERMRNLRSDLHVADLLVARERCTEGQAL